MFPHLPLHTCAYKYYLNTNLLDFVLFNLNKQFSCCLHLFCLLFLSFPIPLPPPLQLSCLHLLIYFLTKNLNFKCEETFGQLQIEGYSTKQVDLGFKNVNVMNDKRLRN